MKRGGNHQVPVSSCWNLEQLWWCSKGFLCCCLVLCSTRCLHSVFKYSSGFLNSLFIYTCKICAGIKVNTVFTTAPISQIIFDWFTKDIEISITGFFFLFIFFIFLILICAKDAALGNFLFPYAFFTFILWRKLYASSNVDKYVVIMPLA